MNSISYPLFGSFTLELSCLLLESHVVELIKFIWLEQSECKLEFIFRTTSELVDFSLGIGDVLLRITGKILELDIVLIDGHGALLQVAELLTHAFNDTGWNVVRTEISAEVRP